MFPSGVIAGNIINDPVTAYVTGMTGLSTSASTSAAYRTGADDGGTVQVRYVSAGDTVQLSDGSGVRPPTARPNDTYGGGSPNETEVDPGDVVQDGANLYRYIGASGKTST